MIVTFPTTYIRRYSRNPMLVHQSLTGASSTDCRRFPCRHCTRESPHQSQEATAPHQMQPLGILGHSIPVGMMPSLSGRNACSLSLMDPPVADRLISSGGLGDLVLPAQLEADGERGSVFDRLASALDGRRQEGMCTVANERDAALRGDEGLEGIPKYQLVVDQTSFRCRLTISRTTGSHPSRNFSASSGVPGNCQLSSCNAVEPWPPHRAGKRPSVQCHNYQYE